MDGEVKKLDDLTSIQYGFPFDSKRFGETGPLRVVRIRDIKGKLEPTFYDGEYEKEYEVENGDILVGMDGEFNCIVWEGGKAVLNQRMAKVVPNEGEVDKLYLFYFLRMKLKLMEEQITGSTVKHLLDPQLRGIEIPTPAFHAQQRIGQVLRRAESLGVIREKANQLTNKIIQSVFLKMFGDPVANEMNWETRKLGELADFAMGGTPDPKRPEYYGGSILWVKGSDIDKEFIYDVPNRITELGLKKSNAKIYHPGTVLIGRTGQGKTRGRTAILRVGAATNETVIAIEPAQSLVPEFVHYNLKLRYKELRDFGGDKLRGGITQTYLSRLPIALPPFGLQDKFASRVRMMEKVLQKQRAGESAVNKLFHSLMDKAFRGELVT